MKESSGPRRKRLEKISFEELMGAAGMSGFGALLPQSQAEEPTCWPPLHDLRLRISLRAAALAEFLWRQNEVLRSLNEPLTRRVKSLEQAIGFLSGLTAVARDSRRKLDYS